MAEKEQRAVPRTFPTSIDVARKAGVSRATVYYALNNGNGSRNIHVSEENRIKVLQAAEELGYIPHGPARTLRKGQSDEICIIADIRPTIYRTEMLVAAQQLALLHGYTPVSYFGSELSPSQLKEFLLKIFARRPVGLFATSHSLTEEYAHLARRMGIEHIVLYSDKPLEYERTILFPTRSSGYLAARHLLELGHRHLATVHPDDPTLQCGFSQRLEGMRAALAEVPGSSLDILPIQDTLASAYHLIDAYLSKKDHPTCIYAFNDEYAVLLLGALIDRGMSVPQDIALMGTDDISLGELVRPTLTTIRFDALSIEQRAIEILVALHKGQPVPAHLSLPLEPLVIPRGSTRLL